MERGNYQPGLLFLIVAWPANQPSWLAGDLTRVYISAPLFFSCRWGRWRPERVYVILGGCYVIVAGIDYCCTPNCLHKRGSGQEAILFLCTCLGDLASLARAADRADPEVCANALLTHAQERPAITPLHVCFHCRARCFHCASSSLILQPHVLRERRETELEREHGRSGSSNSSRHEV